MTPTRRALLQATGALLLGASGTARALDKPTGPVVLSLTGRVRSPNAAATAERLCGFMNSPAPWSLPPPDERTQPAPSPGASSRPMRGRPIGDNKGFGCMKACRPRRGRIDPAVPQPQTALKELAKPDCGPYLEGVTNPDRVRETATPGVGACRTVV